MIEVWKWIPGWEGLYEVSDRGRVRRRRKDLSIKRPLKGRITRLGYLMVSLSHPRGSKSRGVHQIVAETFMGPPPDGFEVNHIDGDKLNNDVSNLEYVTHSHNLRHAHANGLCHSRGLSKLSQAAVRVIRRLWDRRELNGPQTAEVFGVSGRAVQKIGSRNQWTWVTSDEPLDASQLRREQEPKSRF